MATKKGAGGFKRGVARKRGSAAKGSSAAKRGSGSFSLLRSGKDKYLVHRENGRVYVLSSTGAKKRTRHVAKKASAHEITKRIGLSSHQLISAKSLLARLERQGRIDKV
jgi:hypothetical protein